MQGGPFWQKGPPCTPSKTFHKKRIHLYFSTNPLFKVFDQPFFKKVVGFQGNALNRRPQTSKLL